MNTVTVKNAGVALPPGALEATEAKLYAGEEILWTGVPSGSLYILDMAYKAFMWWGMFVFIVPIAPGDNTAALTGTMVLLLTYLEFKKHWQGRAYFITNLRVIYAERTRKGEWKFTDYQREQFVLSKRTALMKSLIMKFKTASGEKMLRFPYLSTMGDAQELLNGVSAPVLPAAL